MSERDNSFAICWVLRKKGSFPLFGFVIILLILVAERRTHIPLLEPAHHRIREEIAQRPPSFHHPLPHPRQEQTQTYQPFLSSCSKSR